MKQFLLIALFSVSLAAPAFADDQSAAPAPDHSPGMGHHGHHGPPPEAIDACKDKKSGEECSFTGHHGDKVDGGCFSPDSSKPLACRPKHGPHSGAPAPADKT